MKLRAEVDKRLSVGSNEVRLSPAARRLVFRGGAYWFPGKVTSVDVTGNYTPESKDAYPYRVRVTRTYADGTQEFSGDKYDSPIYKRPPKTVSELENPWALNRATHVERVARRIKQAAIAFTVITGSTAGILAGAGVFSPAEAHPAPGLHSTANSHDIDPCAGIVTGHETLVPLTDDRVLTTQQLGQTVCSVGEFDYQVAG